MNINSKVHELKIKTEYLLEILNGKKNFECRKNDRDYKVGDLLFLKEYSEGKYGLYVVLAEITYILKEFEGLKEGYVVLGIRMIHNSRFSNLK